MSQRGGSVSSEIRFGEKIASPMIPEGESDYLVVLDETQIEVNQHKLKEDGVLISVKDIDMEQVEKQTHHKHHSLRAPEHISGFQ